MPVVLKLRAGPEEENVKLSNFNESDFMKVATKRLLGVTFK